MHEICIVIIVSICMRHACGYAPPVGDDTDVSCTGWSGHKWLLAVFILTPQILKIKNNKNTVFLGIKFYIEFRVGLRFLTSET